MDSDIKVLVCDDDLIVTILDQRDLPFEVVFEELKSFEDMIIAIKDMHLRGAPLIGVAGAYGMAMAIKEYSSFNNDNFYSDIKNAQKKLINARPTAVNLKWAVDRVINSIYSVKNICDTAKFAKETADKIADEDKEMCQKIGLNGFKLIKEISDSKNGETVNILTHCNAGKLATFGAGTATAAIYEAEKQGIKIHVWVDETRPRNQGARLTAWELSKAGIDHTIIADNTGGHLMQNELVDIVIVGSDRASKNGDIVNKIGTYLKALAAKDNNIPFYAALPYSTIDFDIKNAFEEIEIEQRNENEVLSIQGSCNNKVQQVMITGKNEKASNYAFDITPARLVSGIITELGICEASAEGIRKFYPEKVKT